MSMKPGARLETVVAESDNADVGDVLIDPVYRNMLAVSFDYLKPVWTVLDPQVGWELKHPKPSLNPNPLHTMTVASVYRNVLAVASTTSSRSGPFGPAARFYSILKHPSKPKNREHVQTRFRVEHV